MSNREQILQKQNDALRRELQDIYRYNRSMESLEAHIDRLERIVSKYNNWFVFNRKWINAYNRLIGWDPEHSRALHNQINLNDHAYAEIKKLMDERVSDLSSSLST